MDLRREDSGPDLVPSVERSMERTVNIPARDAGLVSVSPVDDRDLVVTILDASVTMPANSYSSPYATYGVVTTVSVSEKCFLLLYFFMLSRIALVRGASHQLLHQTLSEQLHSWMAFILDSVIHIVLHSA